MDLPKRREITPGLRVQVIEKQNQRSGALTEGVVARLLTSSPTHPHGIKVMLTDGKVGRVQMVIKPAADSQTQTAQIPASSQEKPSASKPA
ncbi:MAG: YwbE family protein [Anaerolineaceae bacterium]